MKIFTNLARIFNKHIFYNIIINGKVFYFIYNFFIYRYTKDIFNCFNPLMEGDFNPQNNFVIKHPNELLY